MEHSQEYLADIKKYDELLKNKNLPVIYSLKHLCLLADVNFDSIVALCNSNRIDRYKRFKLKKKKGGYRIIQSPIGELKYLQRWILCNILENIPSHLSCKGFEKGTSIIENAKIHLNSDSLLKIDLMRFYDSINEKRIFGIFKSLGYQSNLCVSLAKICTIVPNDMFLNSFRRRENNLKKYIQSKKDEGILAQGSPTSPKLSNLVLKNLDKRLLSLAKKHNLNYSRYADDLTFSGEIEE